MLEKISTEVKILFRFYSNILNDWTIETIWASIIDEKEGKYKLLSKIEQNNYKTK